MSARPHLHRTPLEHAARTVLDDTHRKAARDPRIDAPAPSRALCRQATRMRELFDARAPVRGARAAGLERHLAAFGDDPQGSACALLDVIHSSVRHCDAIGRQIVRIEAAIVRPAVEAMAAAPKRAAQCLLAARALSNAKRCDVIQRCAISCGGDSAEMLLQAEKAVRAAVLRGDHAVVVPEDAFWQLINNSIDGMAADVRFMVKANAVQLRDGSPVAPANLFATSREHELGPRCCGCQRRIAGAPRWCACSSASFCGECSPTLHATCGVMIARADALVHRLLAMPGGGFVAHAPSHDLLVPVALSQALGRPSLPVLWPELQTEEIEMLAGHPRLMAERLDARLAALEATDSDAAGTHVASTAADALAASEAAAQAREAKERAQRAARRTRKRDNGRRRREAAARIGRAVLGWWSERRAAARRAQKDAQQAVVRAQIETELVARAVRADAALEEVAMRDAIVRGLRRRAESAKRAARAESIHVQLGRLAWETAIAVLE